MCAGGGALECTGDTGSGGVLEGTRGRGVLGGGCWRQRKFCLQFYFKVHDTYSIEFFVVT